LRITRHRHVPHRVPAVVAVVVVVPVAIDLHAGGIDRELVGGALVVIRVDQHVQPVARRILIAAGEIGHDLVGVVVERAHLHEQVEGVVGDPEFRALARRAAVLRLALTEPFHRRGETPRFLIQRR
jgi:hypothetical protein